MDFPFVAKQMRRFFESCGCVAARDVPAATDFDMDLDAGDLTYDAWPEFREAGRARNDLPGKSRSKSGGAIKVQGGGQVLNGFGQRAGERNRCYTCGREYYLAPRRPQRRQREPDYGAQSASIK